VYQLRQGGKDEGTVVRLAHSVVPLSGVHSIWSEAPHLGNHISEVLPHSTATDHWPSSWNTTGQNPLHYGSNYSHQFFHWWTTTFIASHGECTSYTPHQLVYVQQLYLWRYITAYHWQNTPWFSVPHALLPRYLISMDPHHVQAISPTTEHISTLHYHSYHLYPELWCYVHPKFLSFRVPLPPKLGQGRSVTLGPILVSPHPCMYSSTCQQTESTYHQYPVCPTLGCTPTEPNSTWKDHQSWSRWK
jgi:hypothetical protein